MKLQVYCELNYQVSPPATFILSILTLNGPKQNILSENLLLAPNLKAERLSSGNHNQQFIRLQVKEETYLNIAYQATVETLYEEVEHIKTIEPVWVAQMPASVLLYLLPSRYCQSDQLVRFAQHRFGRIDNDFSKVMAITDWIYKNVEYLSGSSNAQTSAYDTITQQAGVCRDFAHLGIALCRALTIPARYFTCYAYKLKPTDFHACFEAYIGGKWIVFDATRLAPLNGLVKIAHGRDATDVSVATSYGNISLNFMQVGCEALEEDFVPVYYDSSSQSGLSY